MRAAPFFPPRRGPSAVAASFDACQTEYLCDENGMCI